MVIVITEQLFSDALTVIWPLVRSSRNASTVDRPVNSPVNRSVKNEKLALRASKI